MTVMNIKSMDAVKSKMTTLLKIFDVFYKKKIGKDVEESLQNSGNKVVEILYSIVNDTCANITDMLYCGNNKVPEKKKDRYRSMIRNPIIVALAIYYKDSAYRDFGDYMLYHLLEKKDEIMPYLTEKHPKDWYFNTWQDFMDKTHKGWEKGELPEGILSDSEYLMVDSVGQQEVKNYVERRKEEQRKHRRW